MSLAFSDTTNKDGIIQVLERTIFGDNGDGRITGNTTLFSQFTGDVNLSLDKALSLIFQADGRWQFDDSNHTDYPTITTNLVANQRDYPFTTDENSNLILDIKRVMVATDDARFQEILPVDQQGDEENKVADFWDGQNTTGTPDRYDKTANAIFLDPIPSYSETNGLKIFINREASYFTTSDTTKMPGFAGLFHEYCVLRPAYQYAYRNGLTNANALREEMLLMERELVKHYSKRDEHDRPVMTPKKINYI